MIGKVTIAEGEKDPIHLEGHTKDDSRGRSAAVEAPFLFSFSDLRIQHLPLPQLQPRPATKARSGPQAMKTWPGGQQKSRIRRIKLGGTNKSSE